MKNKTQIREEFEKIKKLDAATVLANLEQMVGHRAYKTTDDFFNYFEKEVFDEEDRTIYNELLERKPVSFDFQPSGLRRSWAILAILSSIKP